MHLMSARPCRKRRAMAREFAERSKFGRAFFSSKTRSWKLCAGASFHIEKGETVALVGESGSGKSVSALSVMQLLPYPRASHPHGSVQFDGEEMLRAPQERLQQLRGDRIAMIFSRADDLVESAAYD